MEFVANQFDSSKLPKNKIELHVHLEGAIRVNTLWELSRKKGIHLANTCEELRDYCHIKKPSTLAHYLTPLFSYVPVVLGDAEALERIAYEFCEDAAKEGLIYVELRYSPHVLSSTHGNVFNGFARTMGPADVVEHVNRGLFKGSAQFGVKVRTILVGYRGQVGWMHDVVKLCNEFRYEKVVGVDIAGVEKTLVDTTEEEIASFEKAASLGIHRTFHAGEDGPATTIQYGIQELNTERIGHGYHLVDDEQIYQECLQSGVHFETCPHSSYLTGAVDKSYKKHPIVRLAEDEASFSINRDDPTLIQKSLDDDYRLLRNLGLSEAHFIRANFNAARSSFLPADEKKELIQYLKYVYGVEEDLFQDQ